AAVAFPPALVRALQLVDHDADARRLLGRGDVPDLVREVAEGAQQVDLVRIARVFHGGQLRAVADPHHLRAAGLAHSRLAGDVRDVARPARIGDVDQQGAIVLAFP